MTDLFAALALRGTEARQLAALELDTIGGTVGIYVSEGGSGSTWEPHPEGQYPATCVDVVDRGWVQTDFGPKYKLRIVFFCGEWTEREIEGETVKLPQLVFYNCTASLHEKANLRGFLESWRGKVFTGDELGRFDMEKMLGAPAFIQIVHNQGRDGKVWANIKSIMRIPANMEAPGVPDGFQRACEREGWEGPAPHPDLTTADPHEPRSYSQPDDDLPF